MAKDYNTRVKVPYKGRKTSKQRIWAGISRLDEDVVQLAFDIVELSKVVNRNATILYALQATVFDKLGE